MYALKELFDHLHNLNPSDELIHEAVDKYFHLFVKDWAKKRKLNQTTQQELKSMLEDFACFLLDYSEENSMTNDCGEDELTHSAHSMQLRKL
jgi:hypothetical protein